MTYLEQNNVTRKKGQCRIGPKQPRECWCVCVDVSVCDWGRVRVVWSGSVVVWEGSDVCVCVNVSERV